MTKKKSDLLRTEENKRISPYGEYYINVETIDMLRREREDCETFSSTYPLPLPSFSYPMLIRAVFETDKEYFGRPFRERWSYNLPISIDMYTMERDVYHFDVSIFFPSLTTLNIIKGKCFVKLLLGDKEIYDALSHSLNFSIPNLPRTPPMSAFGSQLKRQIVNIETRLKLQIDYPIAFEDIEEAQSMEVREQALRKFGYENYVKEGFKRNKIDKVTVDKNVVVLDNTTYCYIGVQDKMPPLTKRFNPRYNKDEKLIFMENDICFLQVQDTSTNKTYFLKVPPTMRSVEEAKSWTFGLNSGEYNPVIET